MNVINTLAALQNSYSKGCDRMQIVNTAATVKAVEFKSIPGMFERERDGLKSNTIRIMLEIEYKLYMSIKPDYIKIVKMDKSESFVRRLSDVIDFYHNRSNNEHILLFSWG